MTGSIFNIQRFCLHDGDGIRTTVFMKGCPLHCAWCHNPESQNLKPQIMYYQSKCVGCAKCLGLCSARTLNPSDNGRILVCPDKCTLCRKCIDVCLYNANELCGKTVSAQEVFDEVLKDKIFYRDNGGMTLSGGEPALQADFAIELAKLAKAEGISTVLETCGYGKPAFFETMGNLGATFYFDLKAIDDTKHKKWTGVSNRLILENAKEIMQKGYPILFRLPLIPNINDSEEDIKALSAWLKQYEGKYLHAEIMPYHNLGKSKAQALFTAYNAPEQNANTEDKARWLQTFEKYGVKNIK